MTVAASQLKAIGASLLGGAAVRRALESAAV